MPHLHRSSRVTVELELTPTWWSKLTPYLNSEPEHQQHRALLAEAVAIALELPLSKSVRIDHKHFAVVVSALRDVSVELLAQAAEICRDKLHALDVSCLSERAKYL